MLLEIIITLLSANWRFTMAALIFANCKFWVKWLLNKKQSADSLLFTNAIFTSGNEFKETIAIEALETFEEKIVMQDIKETKSLFIFIKGSQN